MKRFIISLFLLFFAILISVGGFLLIRKTSLKMCSLLEECENASPESLWKSAEDFFAFSEKKQDIFYAFLKDNSVDEIYDIVFNMKSAYDKKDEILFIGLCASLKFKVCELIMYERPAIKNIL